MTTPPTAPRKAAIDTYIKALKAAGIYAQLDMLQVYAAADQQAALLDWVAPARTATLPVAPVFTADRGFKGNSAGYVDTGYAPGTNAVQLLANSISFGFYNRVDGAVSDRELACQTSTVAQVSLRSRMASGFAAAGLNGASLTTLVANANALGLTSGNRNATGAAGGDLRRNGAVLDTLTTAAPGVLPLFNLFALGLNNAGVAVPASSSREIALAYAGGYLTAIQEAALYAATQAYMTAVGAQV